MEIEVKQLTSFSQDTYLPLWMESFLLDRRAANMASGTLQFYQDKLKNFMQFCDSLAITQIDQITPQTIREYLISLEHKGHTSGGVHTFYRTLRAFLRWYESEAEPQDWRNPINKVKPPRVETELLEPADISDVSKMLATCDSKSFPDLRDKAILLVLLDTGVRASELLDINISDLDTIRGDILIKQGKGRKPRTVFVGKRTRKAVRMYKAVRSSPDPALFVTDEGERLNYEGLRALVIRRAAHAGVTAPSLHSFRRFFALACLRAGMDIFTLQKLMGHADLQILRRYLNQIDDDLERGHSQFGPVDRLRSGNGG